MSNEAMTCAWKASDAPSDPGPMFILIILADHASDHSGEDWKAFPSVQRMQERSKFSRAAVERHLATLVDLGWISRRRRVRPDGKKGIYDYELHREADLRADLRAARKAIRAAGEKPTGETCDLAHPCLNLRHGDGGEPCVILDGAMPQFEGKPCLNLTHQEPSVEPSGEPTPGAREADLTVGEGDAAANAVGREPGADGFGKAWALWPDLGRKRSEPPAAKAAWALAAGEAGSGPLLAAVARYVAEDQDLRRGDYGAPAFERWLAKERWRVWLPAPAAAEAAATPILPPFEGPADVFEILAGRLPRAVDPRTRLAGARWRSTDLVLQTRTGTMAEQLRKDLGELWLRQQGWRVERGPPPDPGGSAGR